MECNVVIDVTKDENVIALLEDEKLVELQRERRNNPCALGDIFLAKVTRVDKGLNATFLNLGTDKDAFLSYSEISSNLPSIVELVENLHKGKIDPKKNIIVPQKVVEKKGSIDSFLKKGQEILVQVKKEKINTKGASVTTDLSLAGRMMVLVPFGKGICISKKIVDSLERTRLQSIFESLIPDGFQIVVRTFAEGKSTLELHKELQFLLQEWQATLKRLSKSKKPQRIHTEPDRVICFLREAVNENYKLITLNSSTLYNEVKSYVEVMGFQEMGIEVKMYDHRTPIFDHFDITRQIKALFSRTVTCRKGAYLVIEATEAMHVIDVNSGSLSRKTSEHEQTAFEVNMVAASEIARQLRLRDMGGIVVIDFIDLDDPENRVALHKKMVELMDSDKAAHTIEPLSKFSLMEITRQRVRPAVSVKTEEVCPCCKGSGKTNPSLLLTERIEEDLILIVDSLKDKSGAIFLYAHPFVVAYLKKGLFGNSILNQWRRNFYRSLKIVEDQHLPLLQYFFYDKDSNDLLHRKGI